MKTKINCTRLIVVMLIMLCITCFALPTFAANATVDVEVIVYKQTNGGSEPFENVQVQLGQNSKNTSHRGNVEFRLENIPTTTMVPLHLADPNIPSGSHANLNLKLDTVTSEAVHPTVTGLYDVNISYTQDTQTIVINFMVTKNGDWELLPIEFNQGSNNPPAPPAPSEPEPHEGAPFDPDVPQPGDGRNMDNIWLYVIIGVLALAVIILVIILAVKKKQK